MGKYFLIHLLSTLGTVLIAGAVDSGLWSRVSFPATLVLGVGFGLSYMIGHAEGKNKEG